MLNKLPQTADIQQQTHIISILLVRSLCAAHLSVFVSMSLIRLPLISTWDAIIPRLNLERVHFQPHSYGCWQASGAHPVGLSMAQLTTRHLVSLEVKCERGSPRWKPPYFCNLKVTFHLFRHIVFVERNSTSYPRE